MKKKLLYFLFISSSILLYCGSIYAQVRTKIYYEGVPNERLINAMNNEAEVTIALPENFKKLLAGENVDGDNKEYIVEENCISMWIVHSPPVAYM